MIRVELLDHMGSDVTVVNAARVSMDKRTDSLRERDVNLIQRLATDGHMSPFRHVYFQFRVQAPEFIARQAYKHVVGIATTSGVAYSNDAGWNEVSMRYVRMRECHVPTMWRRAPAEVRQGSSTTEQFTDAENSEIAALYDSAMTKSIETYNALVDRGVAREMARMVLPLSVMTQWIWTMSLQAVVHFVKLRHSSEAQQEIRELAHHMEELVRPLVPISWEALTKSIHV